MNIGGLKLEQIELLKMKARKKFEHDRAVALSSAFFPKEKHHSDFESTLKRLVKFNNKVEMNVIEHTWINMCTFAREFIMVEMDVCFQILQRATPFELVVNLDEYNNTAYPKVMSIVKEMSKTYFNIDYQISKPISDKINSEYKTKAGLSIGTPIKFVIPDYKWGANSDSETLQENSETQLSDHSLAEE